MCVVAYPPFFFIYQRMIEVMIDDIQFEIDELANSELFNTDSKVSLLTNIKKRIYGSEELNDDQRLLLEGKIEDLLISLIGIKAASNNNDANKYKELPSDYGDISSALIKSVKGVEKFNPDSKPFAKWMIDTYLPLFHPMPKPEIQYPVLTAVSLVNPNAVLKNETGKWINKLIYMYFLGLRGSGKSTLAEQLIKLYPEHLRKWTDVSWTGAYLREELSPMCRKNKPCIMVYDNMHPAESFRALGRQYNIFLQNEKSKCVTGISSRGDDEGESEFFFYCSKIVTSIFDLEHDTDPKSGEMLRRFITFCFEKSAPDESYSAYNWCEFEENYYSIWSNTEALKESYFPLLHELEMLSPKNVQGIDAAYWDLIKMPIATGTHLNIWSSVWEGIAAFRDYFSVLPALKKTAVKDLLSQAINKFVTIYYPSWILSNGDLHEELDIDNIEMNQLEQYIREYGIPVSSRDKKEIIPRLMSEYGYVANLNGKKMVFTRG